MEPENENEEEPRSRATPRSRTEGVRIIGADEAAAALEAGQAAGRRPEDQPRFGDVPSPPPEGVRPAHRFPLPDTVDPAAVPRPPVVGSGRDQQAEAPTPGAGPAGAGPAGAEEAGAGAGAARGAEEAGGAGPAGAAAGAAAEGAEPGQLRLPRHDLPHWTEPPTGEVPSVLASGPAEHEDLDAWSGFARGPRWRDQPGDWEDVDFEDAAQLAEETRLGERHVRAEDAEMFDFDRPEERPDEELTTVAIGSRPAPPPEAPAPAPRRAGGGRGRRRVPVPGGDAVEIPAEHAPLPAAGTRVRIATGVGIGVLALLLFKAGPAEGMVLVVVVAVLAAAEAFAGLRRAGYRPATLLGLVATVAIAVGAYLKGETALPLVAVMFIVFAFLWYLAGVVRARPTMNIGATLLGFMWVGFMASYAGLMLNQTLFPQRHGIAFLLGALIGAVGYDVGGFVFGSQLGRHPMAPVISPHKTWEGLVGGMLTALLASAVIAGQIHPWTFRDGVALGLVVAVVAPIGDLCESLIKRDLGVKDMGTMLPGHGGVLDRMDAILFVLPATYYLVRVLGIG